MVFTLFKALALLTLVAAPAVLATPHHPEPSGNPGHPKCHYSCSAQDLDGYPLDQDFSSSDKSSLVCAYPANWPGVQQTSFLCVYDRASGELTVDQDGGLCPDLDRHCHHSAGYNSEDNFTATLSKQKKRAAAPAPSVPQAMKTRSFLGKEKRRLNHQ